MATSLDTYVGQTFSSSGRGLRFRQLNQYMAGLSFLIFMAVSDIIGRNEVDWGRSVFFAGSIFFGFWLWRGKDARWVLQSRITLDEGGLDVVDAAELARIRWPDILYIRIDRSASGHRRKFNIRARGGRLYTLLDPEQGEQLEAWAMEVARPAGVKVKIRRRFDLNGEPLWTFLSCFALLVVLHVTNFFGLF